MRDGLNNDNARFYFDAFPEFLSKNMKRFTYLEDTSNNRSAAYVGAVYVDTAKDTVRGVVQYGRIGNKLTEQEVYTSIYHNDHALELDLRAAHEAIANKISMKTAKNYTIVDDAQVTTAKIQQNSGTSLSPMSTLARNVTIRDEDIPELVEYPDMDPNHESHESLIKDDSIVFERHPNRMRLVFVTLVQHAIGMYTISGSLTAYKHYDTNIHQLNTEFWDLIQDGVVFLGYVDGNENIVIQRYISHLSRQTNKKPLTWAQQKTITTLIMNTLYNDKEDIYDSTLPIYCADYVVNESDKRAMINNRGHGYATNVVFHNPHEAVDKIKYLER